MEGEGGGVALPLFSLNHTLAQNVYRNIIPSPDLAAYIQYCMFGPFE